MTGDVKWGEPVTQIGGHRLPVWGDGDDEWPGTPFHGRWVSASKAVTGAVNTAASFLHTQTVGHLTVWAGRTDTEDGYIYRVWGLPDRPVSATLYRDRDDQTGVHAVFVPEPPPQPVPVPGQVDATVRVLTGIEARDEYPDLFSEDDGEDYFNELAAHGNARWVDYLPDLVLVVANPEGVPVVASNASEWHLRSCGFDVPGARS